MRNCQKIKKSISEQSTRVVHQNLHIKDINSATFTISIGMNSEREKRPGLILN